MRVRRSSHPDHPPGTSLKAGERVRHRREPSLGAGVVVSIGSGPKPVLVAWASGIETYHAPGELERPDHAQRAGEHRAA